MVETVFILFFLLFFILTYQAIEKQWLYEMSVRFTAHERTFWKATTTPFAMPHPGEVWPVADHFGASNPTNPLSWSNVIEKKVPNLSVEGPDSLSISPAAPNYLTSYQDFYAQPIEGWWEEEVSFTNGFASWATNGMGYGDAFDIQRYGGAGRASWTWMFMPMVRTQDYFEREKVVDWYAAAYGGILSSDFQSGFGVDDTPLPGK